MDRIKNGINVRKDKKIDLVTFGVEGDPKACKSPGWSIWKIKQVWDIPVAIDLNGSFYYKEIKIVTHPHFQDWSSNPLGMILLLGAFFLSIPLAKFLSLL